MDTNDDEQIRARLYRMASEHPDPGKREQARRMLDVMPKHPADTRETDFVDQVDNGRAQLLDRTGAPRMAPAGNLREGQDVRRAPQAMHMKPPETEEPKVIPSPLPAGMEYTLPEHRPGGDRTLLHIPNPHIPEYISRPIRNAGNEYLFGVPNLVSDHLGLDSPAERDAYNSEHPISTTISTAAGALAPGSALSRASSALSKGVRGGLTELAQSSPKVAAMLGMKGFLPKVAGAAAEGAGEATALAAARGGVEGSREGPAGVVRGAGEAAADWHNAATGGGFGAAGAVASKVAGGLRDPHIALLERYGMEPGMFTPVINESDPVGLRSATGVSTAGPATRQAAGLDAAESIVSDLNARGEANGRELGAQRRGNERSGLAAQRQPLDPLLDETWAMHNRSGVDPATKTRLRTVNQELSDFGSPDPNRLEPLRPKAPEPQGQVADALRAMQEMHGRMADGPSKDRLAGQIEHLRSEVIRLAPRGEFDGPQRPGTSAGRTVIGSPNRSIPAGDVQRIAAMSGRLSKPDAPGGPGHGELYALAQKLKARLPEPMKAQDRAYAAARTGVETAQDALGIERKPEENIRGQIPRETVEKAGQNIAAASEGTKFGAKATRRIEDLREQGPPETMRGPKTARYPQGKPARGTPAQIDYGSALDQPRIQTAQEALQMNPSALFSGGWAGGLKKLVGVPAKRFIYPVAKGMSRNPASRPANAITDIVQAVKEKKRKSDEDSP